MPPLILLISLLQALGSGAPISETVAEVLRTRLPSETLSCITGEAGTTVRGPTFVCTLSRANGLPSGLEALREGNVVVGLTRPAAIRLEDENRAGEPNVEIASTWWPDMENTWVPIGGKDHPLRFDVPYNGTVIAQPVRYPARGHSHRIACGYAGAFGQ